MTLQELNELKNRLAELEALRFSLYGVKDKNPAFDNSKKKRKFL